MMILFYDLGSVKNCDYHLKTVGFAAECDCAIINKRNDLTVSQQEAVNRIKVKSKIPFYLLLQKNETGCQANCCCDQGKCFLCCCASYLLASLPLVFAAPTHIIRPTVKCFCKVRKVRWLNFSLSCASSSCPLYTGNSRICLPYHFHYRDISEDYCLRPGHAPKLLRQKRLEHAGLCHRHSGVSS